MSKQFSPLGKNQRKSSDNSKSDIEAVNYNSFHLTSSPLDRKHRESGNPSAVSLSASGLALTSSDSNPPPPVSATSDQQSTLEQTKQQRQTTQGIMSYGATGEVNKKLSTSSHSSTSINSMQIRDDNNKLLYGINDKPNIYISILLGLQHYITMLGGTITYPYILTSKLCMKDTDPARGYVIATTLFCSGIASLFQTYLGIRLPIIQGATFTFLVPTLAILTLPVWQCPSDSQIINSRSSNSSFITSKTVTSEEYSEVWMSRMREIQGAIIVSSLVEVFIGFTGILGYILQFITPLSIVPTITLIGLSLFKEATAPAGESWIVAAVTICLVILFSQYLTAYKLPLLLYSSSHRKFYIKRVKVFELFPILLTITFAWITCWLLTMTDLYPKNHPARTDGIMNRLITESPWIRVPYPFQWGIPTVTLSAVLGMTAGVVASAIESIGDYYAAARLSSVPLPPSHAINRGIFMEGVGCVFSGIMGSGGGLTSYSENVGAIGITRIASRQIIATASILMIIMSVFCKFSAIFATVPIPIIGGLLMTMFSMCTAVGLSTLQFVDLNSPRNLFVLGTSLFFGLSIPKWILDHPESIRTTSAAVDQVIYVLMSTSMFVGGFVAIVLDNTIPGTDEERGVLKWLNNDDRNSENSTTANSDCYNLPEKLNNYFNRVTWLRYLPISPTYTETYLKSKVRKMTHKFTSTIVMNERTDAPVDNDLNGGSGETPVSVTVNSSTVTHVKNKLNETNISAGKENTSSPNDGEKSNDNGNKFSNFSMGFFSKDKKKSHNKSNDSNDD